MKSLCALLYVIICFLLSACAAFEPGEARSSTECCPPDSASANVPSASRWLPPNERGTSLPASFRVTDQHGTAYTLEKFKGRPLALSFFYTSCQNPNKCLRVTRQMAALGNKLDSLQMEKQVNLALVSYEPEIDTPQKLTQYAETTGLHPGEHIFLLQIDQQFRDELLDRLQVAVNFNDGRVNIHAIQMFLLDSQARVARTYATLLWDNETVLHDIKRLLAEPAAP
jgi:cytochrome oxidase Cu insertion factor (SCO1/SenC/PrrC family)